MSPADAAMLAACLSHPVRIEFLIGLRVTGSLSPTAFSRATGHLLATVCYHVRTLREAEVIESAGTVPRRGAVEHFYSARSGPRWERLARVLDVLDPSG